MNVLTDYAVRTLLTLGDAGVKMSLNRFRPTRVSNSTFHFPKFLNKQHYLSITPATVLFPSLCTVACQWRCLRYLKSENLTPWHRPQALVQNLQQVSRLLLSLQLLCAYALFEHLEAVWARDTDDVGFCV